MIHSFDHVVVAVNDLARATDVWSTILGRPPSWLGEHADLGTRDVLFRLRNARLELLAPAGPGDLAPWLREWLATHGEGPLGFAFGTDDADACARELRAAGLAAADPRYGEGKELDTGAVRRFRSVLWPTDGSRRVFAYAIEHLSPEDSLPVRAPEGAPDAAVDAIDHVVVQTRDPQAVIELYQDRLGLRRALDRSFPERNVRLIFFRVGGVTVEVAAQLDVPRDPDAHDRLWGLAFQTPDVHATRARLAAAGVDVSETRRGNKAGTIVCTVHGEPTGVPTLLIGPE